MDEIFLPDEVQEEEELAPFSPQPIEPEAPVNNAMNPPDAAAYVKVTFGRFVDLVSGKNFSDVVMRNKDEEIIMSTNLLTDLANDRRMLPTLRGGVMALIGVLLGILFGYFIF